ncbi:MAG: hypothetical protein Q4C65_00570 [Eubacteriales bacterium]|nr:hypothetical protein [Eubacteriales bacterium]
MRRKKIQKGDRGYLSHHKKMSAAKTAVLFALSFAIYGMGIWSTGSNQNLLTIVAVLGCLPACRSAANLVALMRCREISGEDYDRIAPCAEGCPSLCDLELTTYEKTYQVHHMTVLGNDVIGYLPDQSSDGRGCEKHLQSMFSQNGMGKMQIRMFRELPKYINRLEELKRTGAAEPEPEDGEPSQTQRALALLRAISL